MQGNRCTSDTIEDAFALTKSPDARSDDKIRASKRAFTLVELLVVIGIIALLISILLPALGKARAAANQLLCLSNMRQTGMAIQQYTMEYKGAFPSLIPRELVGGGRNPVSDVPGSDWWVRMIPQYMTHGAVIHDWPSTERVAKFMQCPIISSSGIINPETTPSFAMNWTLGPNSNRPYWRKITRYRRPAETIVLSEANYTVNGTVNYQLDDWNMVNAAHYTGGVHRGQSSNIVWADFHGEPWKDVRLLASWLTGGAAAERYWTGGVTPWEP